MLTSASRTALAALGAALLAACSTDTAPLAGLDDSDALIASERGDNAGGKLPAPATVTAVVDGRTVTVKWSAVAEAREYKLQLCRAEDSCYSLRTAELSATVRDVEPGSYSARVRARRDQPASVTDENNGWGESAYASAIVAAPPVAPVAPVDRTPPVITASISGTPGANGWYRSAPTVTWSVVDPESAVTSICPPSTISSETTPNGVVVSCTGTSAGGSASASVTIKFDATAPTIAFSGNALAYTVDQTVAIGCSVSDAASGVATQQCAGLTSDAYLLSLGANSVTGQAADHAGNAGASSQSFTVSVTYASLCALTRRFVTNAGVANSLCVKLDAASRAADRGNLQAKAGALNAYANEVRAQTGKWIPADKVPYLVQLAAAL